MTWMNWTMKSFLEVKYSYLLYRDFHLPINYTKCICCVCSTYDNCVFIVVQQYDTKY